MGKSKKKAVEGVVTVKPAKPGITVRYSTTVPAEHLEIYAYALKVEVLEATGYPDHLFVFHRTPENNEGDFVDTFIQIASPLDVEEVPEDAPRPEDGMPYYRTREVTLWFRNMEDLELAKFKIEGDLIVLTRTYDTLHGELDKQETKRYG